MAEPSEDIPPRIPSPRARVVNAAAASAGHQFAWLWTPESLFRLVLALLLATGLWLFVTQKQDPGTLDFGQPIVPSTTNLGQNLTVTNTFPGVHVRYRTDNPNIFVTPGTFRASVNLGHKGLGTYQLPVDVTSDDPGITVVGVSPATITVVLDQVLTKRVPIIARYTRSNPPPGYQAGTPRIVPSVVQITGPASVASQVTRASVDISLAGAGSTIIEDAKPTVENSQGNPISQASSLTLNPPAVRVEIPISAVAGYKTLPVLVHVTGHPRAGYGVASVAIDPSTITASGPPGKLARISTLSAGSVNVSGGGSGLLQAHLKIHLPKGIKTDGASQVTVTVSFSPVEASSSTNIAVSPENVAPGLVAHLRPADVLVTVVGPASSLRRAAHGLTASVNLINLGIGTYQFTPVLNTPTGLLVQDVNPAQVSVTIQLAPTG